MPYYARGPRAKHPALVKQLAKELKGPPQAGGVKLPKGKASTPTILEEQQRLTERLHVYVIWDKWKNVEDTERGAVIVDAYERALGKPKALQISLAMGLTPEEAKSLGVV